MKAQEAYQAMGAFIKEGYTRQAAFYKTARTYGLSPHELGVLLQSPTRTKERKTDSQQLSLEL